MGSSQQGGLIRTIFNRVLGTQNFIEIFQTIEHKKKRRTEIQTNKLRLIHRIKGGSISSHSWCSIIEIYFLTLTNETTNLVLFAVRYK